MKNNSIMRQYKKIIIILLGNILEYYDFLLFAHLGFIITPIFLQSYGDYNFHLLNLFLVALSFVMRPIGGYILGVISDIRGRQIALATSMKWTILPSLGLAFLPSPETIGIISTILFILFRLLQGLALGGEYPTAGTYFSEISNKNSGFLSSILAASGTVGSLIGISFAFLCAYFISSVPWLWRIGFLLGGVGGYYSYIVRNQLDAHLIKPKTKNYSTNLLSVILVVVIGMLVGVTNWLPMLYTNFYVTQIIHLSSDKGILLTVFASILYIVLTPCFGLLSDKYLKLNFLKTSAIITIPLCYTGFFMLLSQNFFIAQIFLVIASASCGACIHPLMNSLFPIEVRSKKINLYFMLGLSIGGMVPMLSGYIIKNTNFHFFPFLFVSSIALLTVIIINYYKKFEYQANNIL